MVEHAFVDLDLPHDPVAQDYVLRSALDEMGADNWELVSILPTYTGKKNRRITAMRLFFKRADKTTAGLDQGLHARTGAIIPLPGEDNATVVLYCPGSWNGAVFRMSSFAYQGIDVSAVERPTEHGLVCTAVWQRVYVDAQIDRNDHAMASPSVAKSLRRADALESPVASIRLRTPCAFRKYTVLADIQPLTAHPAVGQSPSPANHAVTSSGR